MVSTNYGESKLLVGRQLLGLGVILFLAAELGHFLSFSGTHFATLWPPAGILMAVLLATPSTAWPYLLCTAAVASISSNIVHGMPFLLTIGYPIGNALGAVVGASMVKVTSRGEFTFRKVSHAASFFIFAVLLASALDGLAGSFVTSLRVDTHDFWDGWRFYGYADGTGMIMFCPPIHLLMTRPDPHVHLPRTSSDLILGTAAIGGCIFAVCEVFLGFPVHQLALFSVPTSLFPFIVWTAVSAGVLGATLTSLAMGLVMAYATTHGLGPIHHHLASVADQVANLQIVTLDIVLVSMIISVNIEIARTASHTKTMFLANMSHEFRTPLTAIIGFSELLLDPRTTAGNHKSYVDAISRNGKSLNAILGDVLELSSIEMGKVEIRNQEVNLSELIGEVTSVVHLKVDPTKVKLVYEAAEDVPRVIQTDPLRFRQILLNVIGNAAKFTSFGSIEVSAEMVPQGSRLLLGVTVKDTGIGFDDAQGQSLFKPFTQADQSTKRQFGGTGLGLALSRSLAQMMGGDVVLIASKPNVGSSFLVTINTNRL